MTSNRTLWILQWVFGIYFLAVGITHFIVPDGLPAPMEWMYGLSDQLHLFSGIAEILGGLGLILPGLTKIRPELTTYAAIGLALVMVGAIVYHLGQEDQMQNVVFNVVLAAIMGWIAYGRTKTPLAS
ncbi:MAG: DoxX family protein [Acidimicrobiia bacterium]|nr:DoxX family protein [Acidimicrobiia bacterium]